MYRFIEIPRASFLSRMSHLLRKMINWIYMAWHGMGRAHQFLSVTAMRKRQATEGIMGIYLAKELRFADGGP